MAKYYNNNSKEKKNGGAKKFNGASQEKANVKSVGDIKPTNSNLILETLVGTIEGNSKGFGFLIVEGREDDVFIAAPNMNGAMHGDTVEVNVKSSKRGGGEGEVVNIISRGITRTVGTFESAKSFGFVKPDNFKICEDIYISKNNTMNAKNGDKVVVEIIGYPIGKKIEGRIVEVLGKEGEKGVDILSIIRSYNLYETFPSSVTDEALSLPDFVTESEKKGREDFTKDLVITIDGDDSRDFDDAVCVKELENGGFRLLVHIADVSHYVKSGSKLDKEAYKRGTSVYFPDRVLPMLPEKLSNGICSLNENVERVTLSVTMDIDKNGNVIAHSIKEGLIKSANRMTYSVVSKILDGDKDLRAKYKHLVPMIENMDKLAKILFAKRKKRGNIDFDLTESEIILGADGKIMDIRKKDRLVAHMIIEEFMLSTNETVAEHMKKLDAPFVYRSHETPPSEKIEMLTDFLSALGIRFGGDIKAPRPIDISTMLENLKEDVVKVVNRVTLRSMSKATYEPVNNGHFGLAAPFYCHFTSPIRRYPDLLIHRIIKDYLVNGKSCFQKYADFVVDASKESSARERLAERAERDVVDLKKAEFMADKIGNKYTGTISGVTEFGLFIELENSVEGLLRTDKLPGMSYEYNPKLMLLSNGAHIYRIGQSINIVVESVLGSKISFALQEA